MSSTDVEAEKTSGMSTPATESSEPSTSSAPAAAVAVTKDKEDEESRRPPRSPSPEARLCSICLQDLVNKSYSNTCCHEFCFGCLLEWSKVKPECPLCKASFRSIYHNIRSNSDYDEYVVPAPIPHLSIRLTTSDRFSPEVIVTSRGSTNLGNHDYSLPEIRFGAGSSTRTYGHMRSREVAHAIMRDRLRDPRVIRILQWGSFGEGSTSRAESIDFALQGPALPNDNPFHTDTTPELFGTSLELANAVSSAPAGSSFSGYQGRRRRYDRNQWVAPFDSTLQPGTVFFPSVEYFQRHPSAQRRIAPWLHRELTVLLSLNRSRPQMAFIYDLIVSLLLRFDIRSREFRELLRTYFASKTKHFQHEFYHYVLSGMRMEEYDRVAQYGNTSANMASTYPLNLEDNPASRSPPVVTLDSDEENGEIEITLSDDDEANTNAVEEFNRNVRGGDWLDELIESIPAFPSPLSSPRPSRSQSSFPADLSDSLEPFNPVEIVGSSNINHRRESRYDPDMPILEPQVDLNNLSSTAGTVTSAFRRTTRSSHTSDPSTATRSKASTGIGLLNSLREIYLNPERHTSNDLRQPVGHRDPVDGRRSPYPQPSIFAPAPGTESAGIIGRPLASPDFPVLEFQRRQRQREQEQMRVNYQEELSAAIHLHEGDAALSNMDGRLEEAYRSRLRSHSIRATAGCSSSSSVPENSRYSMPERSSCIHNPSTSTSAQIRIFPTAMDLSTHNSSSSSRSNQIKSVIQSRPRTPGRPPSPPSFFRYSSHRDEGECEFLGVHPVVKKPPLAVITLSSDDEEDRRFKNERLDTFSTETVEQDVFMELFNTTLEPDPSINSLNADSFDGSHVPISPSYAYQMSESLPYPTLRGSVRSARMPSMTISVPPSNFDYSDVDFLHDHVSPRMRTVASPVLEPPRHSCSAKKKSKRRPRSERDSRRSKSDSKKSQAQSSVSLDLGKRKKRNEPSWSKSRSPSAGTSSSSTASDCDYESKTSTSKRKCKASKKKKSKKNKSKSSKKDRDPPQITKSSAVVAASTSGISSKLKSVVVKVDKPLKRKKSQVLIYTSSDSSSEDENKRGSVRLSFSKVARDCKRMRSVIASTSGSITSSPMTLSSSDATASTAALDLRSSSHSQSRSPAATLLPQPAAFRRWESDDDEQKNDNDDTSFETETLLSVGYEDHDQSRSSDSDTDNQDVPKSSALWATSRKRLTSDNRSNFVNKRRDDSPVLFGRTGTSRLSPIRGILPIEEQDLPNSNLPEPLDRLDNVLHSHDVGSDGSSSELRSLSPPTFAERLDSHRHHHHYDVDISYPDRGRAANDDLLDLTVTVTSPVPPVHLWF